MVAVTVSHGSPEPAPPASYRRSAKPEGSASRGKTGLAVLVAGHGASDGGPKGGGVAWLADVGEFMDDDVVEQGGGELHSGPVDVEMAALAERAPPVAEVPDI